MFFLLYRHTDDGVFDDFPKISDHFLKISEDSPKLVQKSHERCRIFSEDYRTLPKTFDQRILHQRIEVQFKRQT